MKSLRLEQSKLGDLEVVACRYDLTSNTQPMSCFDRAYLHNTCKFTDLNDLLDFHRRCGYAGIGYHFAIAVDGTVFNTRPFELQGAQVLGRNASSVGVVLLNAEICAKSEKAQRTFVRLYQELSRISGRGLAVSSHTYGQFEYLSELIRLYNQGLNGEAFPAMSYDKSACRSEILFAEKNRLVDIIIQLRRRGIPEKRRQEFERIVWFVDKLKVCPGESYFVFSNLIEGNENET